MQLCAGMQDGEQLVVHFGTKKEGKKGYILIPCRFGDLPYETSNILKLCIDYDFSSIRVILVSTDRALPNGVLLSHSVRGFNNHRCKKNIQWQRNWDPRVCFKENESFILHTKQFKSFEHTEKCATTIQFSGKPLYLLFLPESSAPVLIFE